MANCKINKNPVWALQVGTSKEGQIEEIKIKTNA